ncbi:unnamed protein product [Meganyctiphanes norvegica]|uniref:Uncharacterized protein n=1 Tax=Meganyctiphanes norvegica TaxID=48144 RepID=A0AAV2S4E5_MEGNR
MEKYALLSIIVWIVVFLALYKYATIMIPLPGFQTSLYRQFTGNSISLDYTQFEHLLDGLGPIYLAADHPRLIQYVKDKVLIPPSKLPYNLSHPEQTNSSPEGQIQLVTKILNKKKN